MTAFERIRKMCQDAQENKFMDAWGIVLSPRLLNEIKAESITRAVAFTDFSDELVTIFGLVLIPINLVDEDKAYIVDEMLGRTILYGLGGEAK